VADRRFDDADYLRKSNANRHANGVYYLGGFVLECLLKAKLLERHPWLQHPPGDRSKWSRRERRLFDLCYRWHDLQGLLDELPQIVVTLRKADPKGRLQASLFQLCRSWSIFARYSPRTAIMDRAEEFLARIKDLKPWLK
jgi:hypothetical protein